MRREVDKIEDRYKDYQKKKDESVSLKKESKSMKLKDLLNESFEQMKVYSNPYHTPFVKENEMGRDEESNEMTTEQKSTL